MVKPTARAALLQPTTPSAALLQVPLEAGAGFSPLRPPTIPPGLLLRHPHPASRQRGPLPLQPPLPRSPPGWGVARVGSPGFKGSGTAGIPLHNRGRLHQRPLLVVFMQLHWCVVMYRMCPKSAGSSTLHALLSSVPTLESPCRLYYHWIWVGVTRKANPKPHLKI